MSEIFTCNVFSVQVGEEDAFLALVRDVTDAATALGGAGEGFILRDLDEVNRFAVIRRWKDRDAFDTWTQSAKARALWETAAQMLESVDGMAAAKVFDIASSMSTTAEN
jgi:heme-degrading monooxygenase HmoA